MSATLVWFRHDLRLRDNPALRAACDAGSPVVPVFVWAPEEEGAWAPASASRWWLHQSLAELDRELRERGSRLIIRRGPTLEALLGLAAETKAKSVVWNRRYEPAVIERDTGVKAALRSSGLELRSFNAALLFEPWTVLTKQGKPYQVYTPFWNACREAEPPPVPLPPPREVPTPARWPAGLPLAGLGLEPAIDWAGGMREAWRPGESGGAARLRSFLDGGVKDYAEQRDRPDRDSTSALSPYLHFGEVSPRVIWHAVCERFGRDGRAAGLPRGPEVFLKELVWREFAYNLLHHFPHTTDRPLREDFAMFPWRTDPNSLRAWQKGRTGYPIVDAAMRQLWHTGWMHNRTRMVVASFLVKDLLLPWQEGARWFWDTLVDADLANNTLGWQWTAGCGADAAPYFRVFNPVSQGEKFDPEGSYVRRWVPELAALPGKFIHKPWEAPADVLAGAGVVLGSTYPRPIVDHGPARERALEALASIRRAEG